MSTIKLSHAFTSSKYFVKYKRLSDYAHDHTSKSDTEEVLLNCLAYLHGLYFVLSIGDYAH